MSRLNPIEKTCEECGKKFFAKRSDAVYCGNLCRAVVSNREKIEKAKADIVAEVTPAIQEKAVNTAVLEMFELIGIGGIQHNVGEGWKIRLHSGKWVIAKTAEEAVSTYKQFHSEYQEKFNAGIEKIHPHHL